MSNEKDTASFIIRDATIDDVPALAALHVATFNETHGNSPAYAIREYQWQSAFRENDKNWFCFVITAADGTLVGFAKGILYQHNDHAEFSGELNKIYILRKFQKKGLGKQLIHKVANEFMRRSIFSMLLFGDAKNPSNGFYEVMGAEKLYAKNGDFHGGYGWKDLRAVAGK